MADKVDKLPISKITGDPRTQELLKQLGNGDDVIESGEIDAPSKVVNDEGTAYVVNSDTGEHVLAQDGYLDCEAAPENWSSHEFGLVQSALLDSGIIENLRGKICGGKPTFQDPALEEKFLEIERTRLDFPKERIEIIQYLAAVALGYGALIDGGLSVDDGTLKIDNAIRSRLAELAVEMGGLTYFIELHSNPQPLVAASNKAKQTLFEEAFIGKRKSLVGPWHPNYSSFSGYFFRSRGDTKTDTRSDEEVRQSIQTASLSALSMMASASTPELLPIFRKVLFDADAKPYERMFASSGLEKIGSSAAEAIFLKALENSDTIKYAIPALGGIGSKAVLSALEEARDLAKAVGDESGVNLNKSIDLARMQILKRSGEIDNRVYNTQVTPYDFFMDQGFALHHNGMDTKIVPPSRHGETKEPVALIENKGDNNFTVTIFDEALLAQVQRENPWATP